MRKPPKPNKTGILLLSLASIFLILLVLYLAVLSPFFAASEEDVTTTVSTQQGEGSGLSAGTVLMFPRVERVDMESIRVYNRYDEASGAYQTYCFEKDHDDLDGDGDTADFIIEGHPVNTYDDERFSRLVVDVGYTACLGRLTGLDFEADGAEAIFARYGLAEGQHPTYYVLETVAGESYTVYVGAKSPDGNYYARLAGREAVYVLYSTMEESVLAPLSYFVQPGLTFAADTTYGYVYIRNFSIFHDRSIINGMFGGGEEKPEFGEGSTLDPFVMFTYLTAPERDVYHASTIYAMLAPSAAYTAADMRVDAAMQKLPGLVGTEVLQLGISDKDFAEGGLLENVAYTIYYEMPYNISYDANEDPIVGNYVKNMLFATPLAADGTYTVGALSYREDGEVFYNMIAKVAYENLSFLEYSLFDWIADEMFTVSIDSVAQMEFSSARGDYIFQLLGDGTADQTVRELYSGYTWSYKGRNYPFELNDRGYCEDISQFRDLYLLLLELAYSGEIAADTGWSEEEIAARMADDSACILTFVLTLEDGREMTYRFYPYSERHSMVSVSGDGIPSVTSFYTSSTAVRRLAEASYQLMNGIEIDPDHRY